MLYFHQTYYYCYIFKILYLVICPWPVDIRRRRVTIYCMWFPFVTNTYIIRDCEVYIRQFYSLYLFKVIYRIYHEIWKKIIYVMFLLIIFGNRYYYYGNRSNNDAQGSGAVKISYFSFKFYLNRTIWLEPNFESVGVFCVHNSTIVYIVRGIFSRQ